MEFLKEILASNAGMILSVVLTLCLTLFSKILISCFRLGVNFKTELASKDEMDKFKKEIRADMRSYKTELTEVLMQTSVRIIEEKLKDIGDVKATAQDMKVAEARMKEQIKIMDEKYAEIRNVSSNMRDLNSRVERLSTQQGNNNTNIRRKDN